MNKLKNILPPYAIIPFIIALSYDLFIYYFPKIVVPDNCYHLMNYSFGIKIPVLPIFFIIYFGAYIQWLLGFISIGRESKELCYSIFMSLIIAETICFWIFIFYPTQLGPDVETVRNAATNGDDILSKLTRFIYNADYPPRILFPSPHCLISWLCFRGSLKIKKLGCWQKYVQFIFSILVFASTVLLGQHVLIDIPGGIIAAELGILITKYTKADSLFTLINNKFKTNKQKWN